MKKSLATSLLFAVLLLPMLQGCLPLLAAGASGGALAAVDRRSLGTQADDETIEWKASARVSEKYGENSHINFTSYNRKVLISGEVSSEEIREAISETVTAMIDAIKRLFERTAPELSADIAERGIFLTGGGALLKGLDEKIRKTVDLPVHVVPDPLECVVKGAGKVLDDLDRYRQVLIKRIED